MSSVLPLFHPTTITFIDDDIDTLDFLVKSLSLKNEPHAIFNIPQDGLHFVNTNTYRQSLVDRLVVPDEEENFCYQSDAIVKELMQKDRYDQISVLVIDYDMPGMTGLQVCESITNLYIKKILLTGAADENLAIDAFNKGLIYQYVRKQDPNFIDHLIHAIQGAQHDYFQELTALPLKMIASRFDSTALVDPAFKACFDDVVSKHHIVEYYLVEAMGSFIMIDNQQQIHALITLDDGLIETYLSSSSADTLSLEQIQAIEKRHLIPCYYDPFNKPNMDTPHLAQHLHRPTVIQGEKRSYYSVLGQGFIPIDLTKVTLFHKV